MLSVGAVMGLLASLVGAGGAFIAAPFMNWCNVPMHKVVATCAALGLPVAIVSPWSFASGAIANFWVVAGGYSFDLTSSSVTSQGGGGVFVTGFGTLKAPGFDNTPGVWRFTSQNPAGDRNEFSFSAANEAQPVPEGGSAVAMLGMGLLGLAAARKKLVKTA